MRLKKILCVGLSDTGCEVVKHLKMEGWDVSLVTDLAVAQRLQAQPAQQVGLLLLDHFLPERMASVESFLQRSRNLEWVGVFPQNALDVPVLREMVLNYFFDFHTMPLDWRVLDLILSHAFRRAQLRGQDGPLIARASNMDMVGNSAAIVHLQHQIRKVASNEAPVLIGGESGSGKELAARAVHQLSCRSAGPFVAVNCGAIAPSLIHTELFGHERGSFTGASSGKQGLIESANGGTLFLDEITDLPLALQTNLLRFLQEHTIHRVGSARSVKVDVRVVAASHVDLSQAVAAGRFRDDLFYRLNVLPITVPPLRARLPDVPILARHFLQQCKADGRRKPVEGFSRQAVAAMLAHDWPGNVRELFNRVQRAVVMTDDCLITPSDLGFEVVSSPICQDLDAARTLAERDAISLTLGRVERNITHAARELGISRMTLYRLMDKHGLAHRVQ